MRVYRIEYREYEYQVCVAGGRNDRLLTLPKERIVIADNAIDAVDLLRSDVRHRIEVASISYVCKVDIDSSGFGSAFNRRETSKQVAVERKVFAH